MKNNRELRESCEYQFLLIEEKELETLLIAGYRMKGKYSEVGEGFKILGRKLGRHINGKAMIFFYDGENKEEDADYEPCFPVLKSCNNYL